MTNMNQIEHIYSSSLYQTLWIFEAGYNLKNSGKTLSREQLHSGIWTNFTSFIKEKSVADFIVNDLKTDYEHMISVSANKVKPFNGAKLWRKFCDVICSDYTNTLLPQFNLF